jgi:murein DD-endopeptidase MepM/ murein hydrolase activator NlpD
LKKLPLARLATYGVVGLLALGALYVNPPMPQTPAPRLAFTRMAVPVLPQWFERVDTLGRGETLSGILTRGGLGATDVVELLRAATQLDARRVPAGLPVRVRAAAADSVPEEITFELAIDRLLRVRRTDSGWVSTEERLPWTTDTLVAAGTISSTLSGAMEAAAMELPGEARVELAYDLADVYEYRVDMSRDLQEGDSFRVLYERSVGPRNTVRVGKILAADFTLSGATIQAVRFDSRVVGGEYFDAEGKSMRAAFLRAPLSFRRISSNFGSRRHPVLGTVRKHKGTDYAANAGTPVRAIGDGVVVHAGWSGGYGNLLAIRHRNGYVTRYGHLKGFARGVRTGQRVTIGQTVAYVGTTGLSTGPHLHFEVLVGGVQRDPRTALRMKGGEPIPASERARFAAAREVLVAQLERAPAGATQLASREP